ncbi:MAG: M20/M25/M40 family metallo-hydrolase [Gammaproteobacteria bacterium]|jgi:acetylornithine deacetylase/succinyl-diaminopimelate desuccinylase-like protein|nr:M20/M25/M40 family metallo-hydrolase [Gammaproteobacteria bacterium]MBT3859033.1 M20/M25/M40 family metallo-hydrolase [Gammaproteobacteria bacterium]MBT3987856.1 M20/M25/M40 family metallo-hydrolase [Gammaproteobacteria bacterium]MBT4254747.1 M20/M25/M40 family metallo-hydrolase [Gammaproteobacteria bacterium]MBT4583294.1 M20/M25/M40 family metallo-hydrolase [Gammaproteobacteria bacterium]
MKTKFKLFCVLALSLSFIQDALAQRDIPEDDSQLLYEIYKELIEYKTTASEQNNTIAVEGMAAWLEAAGFPAEDIFIGGALPHKGNLVARINGTGAKEPIILMAHIDVVEAERDDWNLDPFVLNEDEEFYYGRGTLDDKAMAAIFTANLIRLKQEGFVPNRDIVIALTSDEETGGSNGIYWLLDNQPGLIQGALAINEGGYGLLQDGEPLANTIQISEKIFASFQVTARNPGGHSSLPRDDNAIYDLAEALLKIRDFDFPVELNDVMRVSFERQAEINTGQRAADLRSLLETPIPEESLERLSREAAINAQLRTTAVATLLDGGHASNALPQSAVATVNVRMLPGSDPEDVLRTLTRVVDNPEMEVIYQGGGRLSDPSPLTEEIMGAVEAVTEEMWPGITVMPTMSTGATDGAKMRNAGIPTYGVSGLFVDRTDMRIHGQDERLRKESLYGGYEFLYKLAKDLSE